MRKHIPVALWTALGISVSLWSVSYALYGTRALYSRGAFALCTVVLVATLIYYRRTLRALFTGSRALTRAAKGFSLLLVVFSMVLIYLMLAWVPGRMDFSAQRRYALSQQTKQLLQSIPELENGQAALKIVVFENPTLDPAKEEFADYQRKLAEIYAKYNPSITLDTINMAREPQLAREYRAAGNGAVVFEAGTHRQVVQLEDVYRFDPASQSYAYRGEIAYTAAIKSLFSGQPQKLYFLTGHGEVLWNDTSSLGYSAILSLLRNENLQLESLPLEKIGKVPADAGIVVIANPVSEISANEMDALQAYLYDGGSVFVLLQYDADPLINSLLLSMGLFFEPNLVLEQESYLQRIGKSTIVPYVLPDSAITAPLFERREQVVMPRSMAFMEVPAEQRTATGDFRIQPLLQSTQDSWAELSLDEIQSGTVKQDEKDVMGPFHLGFAVTRAPESNSQSSQQEARMVAIGSVQFPNNVFYKNHANSDLFLNAVEFLLRREAQITIRPKEVSLNPATVLPLLARRALFLFSTFFILGFVSLGVGIRWARHNGARRRL